MERLASFCVFMFVLILGLLGSGPFKLGESVRAVLGSLQIFLLLNYGQDHMRKVLLERLEAPESSSESPGPLRDADKEGIDRFVALWPCSSPKGCEVKVIGVVTVAQQAAFRSLAFPELSR